jgi:hypothetical protein
METRNRIIASLSALYLIAAAITPSNHENGISTDSERSSKERVQKPRQPEDSVSKPEVFAGTILKSGIDFLLRDSSGEVYLLDAREDAELFEGEYVRITGIREADAKILRANAVEELTT